MNLLRRKGLLILTLQFDDDATDGIRSENFHPPEKIQTPVYQRIRPRVSSFDTRRAILGPADILGALSWLLAGSPIGR